MSLVPGILCYTGVVVAIALLGLVDRAISLLDKRINQLSCAHFAIPVE